jgi:hypothetical protein
MAIHPGSSERGILAFSHRRFGPIRKTARSEIYPQFFALIAGEPLVHLTKNEGGSQCSFLTQNATLTLRFEHTCLLRVKV